MNQSPPQTLGGKTRWNPWPVAILVFFSVAIASVIGFVIFSTFHNPELVAADYYEQEIRYDAEMQRIERTSALSSSPLVGYDSKSNSLSIAMPAAQALSGMAGTVHLYRPSSAGLDRQFPLTLDAAGSQAVHIALAPGAWKVKLRWNCDGSDYQFDQNLLVSR